MTEGQEADEGLRLLVLDPELAMAQALAEVLAHETGVAEAVAAASIADTLAHLETAGFVLLVHDSDALPRTLTMVSRISNDHPEVPLVVLSSSPDASTTARMVFAGARGWVDDSAQVHELIRAAEGVAAGEWWFPRGLLGAALRESHEDERLALEQLTRREREVLDALVEGLNRAEIAERLQLSVNTVRTHIQHLLVRLGVHTALEAVSLALQHRQSVSDEGAARPGARP